MYRKSAACFLRFLLGWVPSSRLYRAIQSACRPTASYAIASQIWIWLSPSTKHNYTMSWNIFLRKLRHSKQNLSFTELFWLITCLRKTVLVWMDLIWWNPIGEGTSDSIRVWPTQSDHFICLSRSYCDRCHITSNRTLRPRLTDQRFDKRTNWGTKQVANHTVVLPELQKNKCLVSDWRLYCNIIIFLTSINIRTKVLPRHRDWRNLELS